MECQDLKETDQEISSPDVYPKFIFFLIKNYLDIYDTVVDGKLTIGISKNRSDLVKVKVDSAAEMKEKIEKLSSLYIDFMSKLKEV